MPVITIARKFGAGGSSVGQLLADSLKADLLDPQLIAVIARLLELPNDEVEGHDEQPGSLLGQVLGTLGSMEPTALTSAKNRARTPPYSDPTIDTRLAVIEATQHVIRAAARSANVVIVGRGGAYILRDLEYALHVFLGAADETRAKTVMERFSLGADDARRRMKQTDAKRTAYIRQAYGHDWTHASHYDLMLDTGRLGYTTAASVILAALPGRGR